MSVLGGKTGRDLLVLSISQFDPSATLAAPNGSPRCRFPPLSKYSFEPVRCLILVFGNRHEAARFHHADRRCNGCLTAVCAPSAARRDTAHCANSGYFPLAFSPSLDLATTIFNRRARLRTAALLRFTCVAIAATLVPDSASVRRRLSSSDVQGMLPTTGGHFFALTESEASSFGSLSNLVLQMVSLVIAAELA
jgi:hypothetical protein